MPHPAIKQFRTPNSIHPATSFTDSSNMDRQTSISSAFTVRDGEKRMLFSPQPNRSNPFSKCFLMIRLAPIGCRLLGRAILYQFNRHHQAFTAHIAHTFIGFLQLTPDPLKAARPDRRRFSSNYFQAVRWSPWPPGRKADCRQRWMHASRPPNS